MAGTGVGKYSTTASNNTAVQSTNWAEGMAPSDVNNAARETLANVRAAVNDIAAGYVELGDTDGEYTVTKIDADTFTINTASDLRTDYYQVGRKIKVTHSNGVTSGIIESTAYSSPTLTVNLSGANITGASITKVELGLPSAGGAANLDMDDNAKLRLGDSQDLQIYHDSNHSYIEDSGTGDLKLKASIVEVQNTDATVGAKFTGDGSVELNHNGTKKLETTSAGATVSGDLAVSGSITAGGTNIAQSAYPVGSIYMNINATDPNTLLGFGTWARFGEGKMLVSQNASDSDFDTSEETGGAKTHTLSESNLAEHSHFTLNSGNGFPNQVSSNGALTKTTNSNGGAGNNDYVSFGVSAQANQSPSSNTGSGTAVNHMNPYIVVYMWKRTA
tara:strand:+ start:1018 stop:2184 length:1167 start_codon:yes stop_codon:yes gene_type:complete